MRPHPTTPAPAGARPHSLGHDVRPRSTLHVALRALTAVALTLPFAPHAMAQTQGQLGIALDRVSVGGTVVRDESNDDLNRPFNEAECIGAANVEATYALTNLPTGVTFVDIWIGNATQDCSLDEARQTGDNRQCTHLTADPDIDGTNSTITISLEELFLSTEDINDPCDGATAATGEQFLLWVFAATTTETTGSVTPDQYGYITLEVDSSVPAAPVLSEGNRSGDTSVPIGWDPDAEANLTHNVYVDTSIAACGDGGALAAGDPPPGINAATFVADEITGTSTNVSTSASNVNLSTGQSALVFVTSVDDADNESVLSNSVCITRVETGGFCELYEADTGEPCPQDCSVRRAGVGRSAPPWASLVLLFGVLGVRRTLRRRRSARSPRGMR